MTVFFSSATPTAVWGTGYGGALSSTWFQVLSFEGEAARQRGETTDVNMTSFTASALLAPPVGIVTPYGGLGVGFFRQTRGSNSDTGRLRALVLGVKLRLGGLLLVKGEYRRLNLSGTPLLLLDNRVSVGAGISF